MKNVVRCLSRVVWVINCIIKDVGCIILLTIFGSITAGIISRYIFNRPFNWTEELTTYMMVWQCYIATTCTTIEKNHIVADFFISKAPEKVQKLVGAVSKIMMVVFFIVVINSVVHLFPKLIWKSAALGITRKMQYIPLLIGFIVMLFAVIVDILTMFFPGSDYVQEQLEKKKAAALQQEMEETEASQQAVDLFMAATGISEDVPSDDVVTGSKGGTRND